MLVISKMKLSVTTQLKIPVEVPSRKFIQDPLEEPS